jgi:Leucine-rich repeat (LRR) protein
VLLQVGTLSSFHLNVSHNALQQLELNATRGRNSETSANVKVLDVSHNNVTFIGHGYLRPVEESLTHLHLSHNGLINATREVFGNMPHLQWLDLSNNQLVQLDFDTFRNTKMLQVSNIMESHDDGLSVQSQF